MKDYILPKDHYTQSKFDDLAFAVAHYGTEMHKTLWNLMVDADLDDRQMFKKYTNMLRHTSAVNNDILNHISDIKNI